MDSQRYRPNAGRPLPVKALKHYMRAGELIPITMLPGGQVRLEDGLEGGTVIHLGALGEYLNAKEAKAQAQLTAKEKTRDLLRLLQGLTNQLSGNSVVTAAMIEDAGEAQTLALDVLMEL